MKTALITGASGGIGRAVAERLCTDGYAVALNYNESKKCAENLASLLISQGGIALTVHADVSDSLQVKNMFAYVRENCGHIDVLVNNAGISQQKLFCELSDCDWAKMMGVNLNGVFYCCREALPGMLSRQHGSIVNISSVWGQEGGSMETHYSAAKAGVIGLTKALAKETAPSGVTVNAVAPGVIRTKMLDAFTEDELAALYAGIPAMRPGTPEDVAAAVGYLVSEGARYVTGQVLAVNGGFYV